jgi:hypothetical protein
MGLHLDLEVFTGMFSDWHWGNDDECYLHELDECSLGVVGIVMLDGVTHPTFSLLTILCTTTHLMHHF